MIMRKSHRLSNESKKIHKFAINTYEKDYEKAKGYTEAYSANPKQS